MKERTGRRTKENKKRRIEIDTAEENFFPARVSKSGNAKVIGIPEPIRDEYEIGETVFVTLRKKKK